MPSCSFFWYYLPSYWFYCNEWNFQNCMLYLLYDDKENHTQKHYRCKTEIFFPPQLYFFTQLQKVVFFNVSRTLTAMQNRATPRCPLNTNKQSQVNLFTFLSEGFQWWNYILLLLSELYYCSSILHFKNKTLILLWRCCPFLVLRRSFCDPRASGPLAGPRFQPPNKTRRHGRGLGTTDPVKTTLERPQFESPAVPHPTWQRFGGSAHKNVRLSPKSTSETCDVTPKKPICYNSQPALCPLLVRFGITKALGLFPRLTAGGSTPLLLRTSCWKRLKAGRLLASFSVNDCLSNANHHFVVTCYIFLSTAQTVFHVFSLQERTDEQKRGLFRFNLCWLNFFVLLFSAFEISQLHWVVVP